MQSINALHVRRCSCTNATLKNMKANMFQVSLKWKHDFLNWKVLTNKKRNANIRQGFWNRGGFSFMLIKIVMKSQSLKQNSNSGIWREVAEMIDDKYSCVANSGDPCPLYQHLCLISELPRTPFLPLGHISWKKHSQKSQQLDCRCFWTTYREYCPNPTPVYSSWWCYGICLFVLIGKNYEEIMIYTLTHKVPARNCPSDVSNLRCI